MSKVKHTLGGQPNIKKFVDSKIAALECSDKDMRALFSLMFSEKENIIAESTDGYRIKKVTYGESLNNVKAKAGRLAALLCGVPANSIVGIYLNNSLDFIECLWATLMAGYRPLLLNTRLQHDILDGAVKSYGVAAVISCNDLFSAQNITLLQLCSGDGAPITQPFANEVFLMSSNTSNNLKICGYTGEQLYYQIKDSAGLIKESKSIKKHYNGSLKLLTFLPFCHIFGLVAVYIWFCFFSRTLVFLKDYNPKTILSTVKKHEVTHIFAVPVLWERVYKSAISGIRDRGEKTYNKFKKGLKIGQKLSKAPLLGKLFTKKAFKEVRENIFGESVMFAINGGGYISPEAVEFVNGIGYYLVNGYGMTELGITSVELSEKAHIRNLCSVGKPFSSLEYKINDAGELLVRGKSIAAQVFSGGAPAERDEWFNTHDLFTLRGGRYYIQGRKDDLIICSSGENINPNLIEPLLNVSGAVRVCLAPSAAGGKVTVIAEVNPLADSQTLKDILSRLQQKVLSLNFAADVDGIVLTSTPLMGADEFKLNRKSLAAKLKNGGLKIIDPERGDSDAADALTERLREIFAEALSRSKEDVLPDSHFFFELGGSSLDYFTMITAVQAEFNLSFPVEAQSSVSTVRGMAEYIKKHTAL